MSIRLGGYMLTPNTVMVLLAGGFFLALAFRRLYPAVTPAKSTGAAMLLLASCFGGVAGYLHARLAGTRGFQELLDLHMGSLGGYWGVVLGMLLAALVFHRPAAVAVDALVPGLAVGGMLARVGCLFTGCCRGYETVVAGVSLWYPWPLYDIAALAAACGVSAYMARKPGQRAAVYFLCYGALRFLLEFARPPSVMCGPLSCNAVLALCQMLMAASVLMYCTQRCPRA